MLGVEQVENEGKKELKEEQFINVVIELINEEKQFINVVINVVIEKEKERKENK